MNGMASYCSKCGSEIAEGTRFCPACGFDTMGQGAGGSGGYNQNNNQQYNNQQSQGLGGTLTLIVVLGLIWAILSIISGLYCLFWGAAVEAYFGYGLGGIVIVLGILSLLSGLFAILSCVYIIKLEKFSQARTYCLVGSIIAIFTGGIIAGVIGIVFFIIMKDQKSRFKS